MKRSFLVRKRTFHQHNCITKNLQIAILRTPFDISKKVIRIVKIDALRVLPIKSSTLSSAEIWGYIEYDRNSTTNNSFEQAGAAKIRSEHGKELVQELDSRPQKNKRIISYFKLAVLF